MIQTNPHQTADTIQQIALTAQALSDKQRLRALLALRGRELCVCHLIDLLGLAPSTISKHLNILYRAGLINRRKEGRWVHYSLATGKSSPLHIRRIIKWACEALADDHQIADDENSLAEISCKTKSEVCQCYEKN